jgi:hypothetical protein
MPSRVAAAMSRSTPRAVRYSRLRLPTVTFAAVEAASGSREFSKEIADQPIRTVTNFHGGVTAASDAQHVRHGERAKAA